MDRTSDWGKKEGVPYNCKHGIPLRVWCKDCPDEKARVVRTFTTGATRDTDVGKIDYEAFLSPLTLKAYAEYMHKNRFQKDGSIRSGDNWQKGIPDDVYMKSNFRHFMDLWRIHRGYKSAVSKKEALCAILFNTMGMLHEDVKGEMNGSMHRMQETSATEAGKDLPSLSEEEEQDCPY